MDSGSPVERKCPTLVGPQGCHPAETPLEVHQAKSQHQSSSAAPPCFASWEMAPDLPSDYSWLYAAGAAVG